MTISKLPQAEKQSLSKSSTSTSPSNNDENDEKVQIAFPGGGIYFYWQIGAASYLRDIQQYDLSNVQFTGASAGALAATLTVTNVNFVETTHLALKLAEDAGVWDRPLGLQGIWGPMIEEWLDELIPSNAIETVEDRLTLLVTPIPSFGKTRVSSFESRQDLISCNMASVHLPWFLDGKLTRNFRNKPHIDGSFLSKPKDYFPTTQAMSWADAAIKLPTSESLSNMNYVNKLNNDIDNENNMIILDWSQDEKLSDKGLDFVSTKPKEFIWSLIEDGKQYAQFMEEQGMFQSLIK